MKANTYLLIFTSLLFAAVSSLNAQTHEWIDATGKHKTSARFIELRSDSVTLRKSKGKEITVPIEKLGNESRALAQELQRESKAKVSKQRIAASNKRFQKWLIEIRPKEQSNKIKLLNLNRTTLEHSPILSKHEKDLRELERFSGENFESLYAHSVGIGSVADKHLAKAQGGVMESTVEMAKAYYPVDSMEGLWWLHKAAEKGHLESMALIGGAYTEGSIVKQNSAYAFGWLSRASGKGNLLASSYLVEFYRKGIETQKDSARAFQLAAKCASAGYSNCMFALGQMYGSGEGTKQDLAKSSDWFLKAAQNNNADAMVELGKCFWNGKGVPENRLLGFHWMSKGAKIGGDDVQKIVAAIVAVIGIVALDQILGDTQLQELESSETPFLMHEYAVPRFRKEQALNQAQIELNRRQWEW